MRERYYLLALLGAQRAVAVLMGSVVLVLHVMEVAELVVPIGFEGVGDKPVVGVDGEVAATGEFGVVAGAFDVFEAQLVGLVCALVELGGDGQRDLEREWGERLEQQRAEGFIELAAGDDLAGVLERAFDRIVLAGVFGQGAAAAVVVADGHPGAAAFAYDEALQQGGSLAGRALLAVLAVCAGVGGERGEVGLVLRKGDVAGVRVGYQCDPLLAGDEHVAVLARHAGGGSRTRRRSGGCAGRRARGRA